VTSKAFLEDGTLQEIGHDNTPCDKVMEIDVKACDGLHHTCMTKASEFIQAM